MYVVKTLNFPITKKLRKLTFKLDQSTRAGQEAVYANWCVDAIDRIVRPAER